MQFREFPRDDSFGEVFSAMAERVLLQLRTKSRGLKPIEEGELFRMITDIKNKYDIYKKDRGLRFRDTKIQLSS